MSGRTIGTLVGAAAGIAVAVATAGSGTPISIGLIAQGAALGGTVGGLAGTLYDSAHTKFDDVVNRQERLADLSIQTSTLGTPIPQLWGRMGSLAGNVIWATDKVPHEHREVTSPSSGGGAFGKGGPTGPKQVNISITYTQSYAIALCDTRLSGPMAGLSTISRNNNLIWSMEANGSTLPDGWTFYPGTATQDPDPTMEAILGVGLVPRYPYLCYVVIADDDQGQSGQTPVYNFELWQQTDGQTPLSTVAVSPLTGTVWTQVPTHEALWAFDPTSRERSAVLPLTDGMPLGIQMAPLAIEPGSGEIWAGSLAVRSGATPYTMLRSTSTGTLMTTYELADVPASNIVFSGGDAWMAVSNHDTEVGAVLRFHTDGSMTRVDDGSTSLVYARLAVGADGHVWLANLQAQTVSRITPATNTLVATVSGVGTCWDLVADLTGAIWVADRDGNTLHRIAPGTNTVNASVAVTASPVAVAVASDGALWALHGNGARTITRLVPASLSTLAVDVGFPNRSSAFEHLLLPGAGGAMWCLCRDSNTLVLVQPGGTTASFGTASQPLDIAQGSGTSVWVTSFAGNLEHFTPTGRLGGLVTANSVGGVVTTLCHAVGLDDVDVAGVPDDPINMILLNVEAARAPIEQLAQAYRFYAVESGTTITFRQRGAGDLVFALTDDDLGADENQARDEGLQVKRVAENELPTSIEVQYIDPAQHYQRNTQAGQLSLPRSSIENARSINVGSLALPAAQARQLATELVVETWVQREALQSVLSRAYAALEPGDRGTITARGLTYTAVITETTYGAPGLVEFTAVVDAAYIRNALIAPPGVVLPPPQMPPIPGDTTPLLLNLPALHQADQAPRYHVAYQSDDAAWPGAALYISRDGAATYQLLDSAVLQGITGTVQGTIAAHDWHSLDTTTVLTVVLDHGSLSSVSDLALYNSANRAAVGHPAWGWELIGFGQATLVAPMTYELSRILWGRRGTEWACTAHVAGETFVLLDAGLRPLTMTLGEQNIARPYKSPTVGQQLSDVDPVTFTPTAENQRPWSVAQPDAVLSGTDWVLTWRLRSRFNAPGMFGPIGFDPDFVTFKVVIYTDNTYASVVRETLTEGGNPMDPEVVKSWTYSTTDQTSDFGAPQTTLYWRVYTVGLAGVSHADDLIAA